MGLLDKIKGGFPKKKQDDVNADVEESTIDDDQELNESEDKPKKKRKGLGGLFGGRKKSQKGIIDSMGLNEAVASMSLSVLESIVESNEGSAVRELDDGYTVIALTEEMLQELNIDTKSADFGSFANAIASEHIESVLLANDLHNGVLAIIPDRDTLDILEEFSFIENLAYRWAVVPFDIDDESTIVLLENGATLGDLNVIADDDIDLVLRNSRIEIAGEETDIVEDTTPLAGFEEVEDEPFSGDDVFGEVDDDPFGDEDDVFDDLFDDSNDMSDLEDEGSTAAHSGYAMVVDVEDDDDDDIDAYDEATRYEELYGDPNEAFKTVSKEDDAFDLDDDLDDLDDELDDLDDDLDDLIEDTSENTHELQSLDEGREMIQEVLDREFHNDELGLSLKGDAFNQQFGDVHVISFDEEPLDDSALSHTVTEMRRDANTRLYTLHNTNLQKLRSHYQNGLSEIHDKLVDILDYKDADTPYGERYVAIVNNRSDKEDMADELIAQNREQLDKLFNEKRDAFADRARREALGRYDDQYKKQHDDEKKRLGDDVETRIQLDFDKEVSELYDERRNVATRIFDKMTTGLLVELQKIHEENINHEQELYEQFHSEIDKYTRENYTDEVLRASALATQQRQRHEADEVRAEYEQMLASKQRQLEESEARADAELRKLEQSHSKTVQESVAEYRRQAEKRDAENRELRDDMSKLQHRIMEIGREKDEEYSQRLRSSEDTIEGQRKQLEYEQDRANKQGKQSGFLLAGMVIVGIALGLLGGFLMGTSRNQPIQQAPGAGDTAEYGTVYLLDNDSISSLDQALSVTFNQLFADDVTLSR